MGKSLKTLPRRLLYALKYPGVTLGDGCFVRDSRITAGVSVGAGSTIAAASLLVGSNLGRHCVVDPGAKIATSTLGDLTRIEAETEVYGSRLEGRCAIQPRCYLNQVELGSFSYVGRAAVLDEVTIGRFCSIGPRTLLGAGDHPADRLSTSPAFYSTRKQANVTFAAETSYVERKRIVIGHDVWIGAHVFVRDGVSIGNGAIVAAGAVVTKDVEPYSIVGGVPAKVLKSRFAPEHVKALERLEWWNWPEAKLRAGQPLLARGDVEEFLAWERTFNALDGTRPAV